MTEPREPETTLDEGESTRPIGQPDPASWYPVDPARPEAVELEASPQAPEPSVDEPFAEEPPKETAVVEEPVAEAPVWQRPVAEEPAGEPVAEDRAAEEPVIAEPAATEPAATEPEATDSEPTVNVAATEPTHTLFGDAEPTLATSLPAEDVVTVEEEPVPVEETVALETAPTEDQNESTSVLPRETVAEPLPPTAPTESIFRQPSPTSGPEFEPTRVEQLSDEEQKLAAERAARRDARATALAATAPVPVVAPDPVIIHKRTNDKFWGSVGLFLLRLVLAAILAVRGLNLLTDIPAAQTMFATTIIPAPGIMAIVTGVAALLIALALILGLLTRLAGLGIALIGAGALTFFYWGNWSPFVAGRPGFLGDYELLLTAVGILLLCIGAGGWSLDRSIRSGREHNKAERASAGA